MKIVYHPKLTMGSQFLNRFHPFEFDRAERALGLLRQSLGSQVEALLIAPDKPVELSDLLLVHDEAYLKSLRKSSTIAHVIEVPLLALCPHRWLDDWFLTPARWSVACSLLAAETALTEQFCMCLGGGFHHAMRRGGEGFCLVSDIAFVIETLRAKYCWGAADKVLYLDLDVHQGNGVTDYYADDPGVRMMDVFNEEIYPVYGKGLRAEWARPVGAGCEDGPYLELLNEALDTLFSVEGAKILIYNAGTDVYREDRLGGFLLSKEGVLARDLAVIRAARAAGVPLMAMASGGYSITSAELLANCALAAHKEYTS